MAKLITRGKKRVYWIDYLDENGIRKKRSLKTANKNIAEILYGRFLENIEKRRHNLQASDVAIDVLIPKYLKHCQTHHSSRTYEVDKEVLLKHFVPFLKVKKLSQVTKQMLEDFKLHRLESVKPATVNRQISIVKAMFSYAVENDYLDFYRNPAVRIKKLPENKVDKERALSKEEIAKILAACEDNPRMKDVILTFLYTGMRLSELRYLRWEDINLEHGIMKIRNKPDIDQHTKNYKERVLKVHPAIQAILQKLKTESKSDYVFATSTGESLQNIKRDLGIISKKSGVKFSQKSFRHTFCSYLLAAGYAEKEVQDLLGHSHSNVTKIYSHSLAGRTEQAIKSLNFGG